MNDNVKKVIEVLENFNDDDELILIMKTGVGFSTMAINTNPCDMVSLLELTKARILQSVMKDEKEIKIM